MATEATNINLEAAEQTVVDARKQHIQELELALAATLKEEGQDVVNKYGVGKGNITVVNVLGYTDTGSIVETAKAIGKKGEPGYVPHKVSPSAKNVGYVIQNTGVEAIEYDSSECELVNGQYVVKPVKAVLQPGESAPIRRTDLTKLLAREEYSFEASNGKLKALPSATTAKDTVDKLNGYTFSFTEGSVLDRQIQIGIKGADGKWSVATEYKTLFGDEENEKPAAVRAGRTKSTKVSGAAKEANYIRRLLMETM